MATVVREGRAGSAGSAGSEDELSGGGREVVSSADTDVVDGFTGPVRRSAGPGVLTVVAPGASVPPAVEATLDAVDARRVQLRHSDVRLDLATFDVLRAVAGPVVGVGTDLGPADRLARRPRFLVERRPSDIFPEGGA